MNDHSTWRLFQWFGYMSPTATPLRSKRFSEPFARSRWYGSSRHQPLESPQLSATIMLRTAPLYWSAVNEPPRQNAWLGAPSLTPVQKSLIFTWTQRPQFSPLFQMPIFGTFAPVIGRG